MRFWGFYVKGLTLGAAIMGTLLLSSPDVQAKTQPPHKQLSASSNVRHGQANARLAHGSSKHGVRLAKNAKVRYARFSGLQCVPFARAASGIELKGNAANWWDAAAGVYERGARPEPGSVLNFRSNGRMRLGHVAVVTAVIGPRELEIEHANWAGPGAKGGGISRGIPVIDVSENNDWSAVRVGLGRSGDYGSVYPTYGFIYDRPDTGVMVASTPGRVPQYAELQPNQAAFTEVAEAPATDDGDAAAPVRVHGGSRHAMRLHVIKRRHH